MTARTLLLTCLLGVATIATPVLAQPSLSYASPSALIPGKTIRLDLSGKKLTEPLSVWTSFESKIELTTSPAAKKKGNQVRCNITIPADLPIGLGGIIVATKEGPSNVYLVMIDDLPSVAANGKNTSLTTAQSLTIPTAVDGNQPRPVAASSSSRRKLDSVSRWKLSRKEWPRPWILSFG